MNKVSTFWLFVFVVIFGPLLVSQVDVLLLVEALLVLLLCVLTRLLVVCQVFIQRPAVRAHQLSVLLRVLLVHLQDLLDHIHSLHHL